MRNIVSFPAFCRCHSTPFVGLRAFYRFTFSALLLLYNKAIVDEDHFAFPYPLFGTTFQMPIQFALAAAFRCVFCDVCYNS